MTTPAQDAPLVFPSVAFRPLRLFALCVVLTGLVMLEHTLSRRSVGLSPHQLLPKAPIHDSRDSYSYEGNSPALHEGYFEDLHWGIAQPWLERQVGKR